MMSLIVLCLGLAVGALIGCIGIGGVLLVPSLTYVGGVPIHESVSASMFGYLFSGFMSAWIFARHGSIDWSSAAWLSAGAMPGAFLGAMIATWTRAEILEALIAAFVIYAGLRSLRRAETGVARATAPSHPTLLLIGAGTGLGSAMSGTGGPLLLVPTLMWLNLPILQVIGLGQAIQVPIGALATAGNIVYGRIDFALAVPLALALLLGAIAGARLAQVVTVSFLARLVGIVMLGVGALMALRSAYLLLG